MQAPSPGTTLSPIWNQVGTIAGAIAAVFTVLFWAGITPSVLHQHGRSAVKSRPKEYSILVGSCITISLAIPAFLEYVQLHSVYPIAAWTIVGILCSLIATNWILVWRSSRKPLHSLDNSPLTPLQMDILALSRELRAFLQNLGTAPMLHDPGPIKAGEHVAVEMIKRNAEADAWHVAYGEWARRRLYGYQSRYLRRVEEIANEIGAKSGMVIAPLLEYVNDVKPLMDFDALPDILAGFVAKLEKPEERRRFEEERRMQETRALLMDRSHEGDNK